MKKFLPLLGIFLFSFQLLFAQPVSTRLYNYTNSASGYWPASLWGQTNNAVDKQVIFFDDIQIPRDSIGAGADSIGLTAIDVGIFRAANAPATTLNFWVMRWKKDAADLTDAVILPPRRIGQLSINAQGGSDAGILFRLGDSSNILTKIASDSNVLENGLTTFFLGVSFSDTTGSGVFLGTANTGFVNLSGAVWQLNQNSGALLPFNFGQSASASIYARVFGRAVSNSLPVTFTRFEGKKIETGARLTWRTATEQSNAGFDLERSADGKDFTKVATIKSKAQGGNSVQPLDYGYDDNSVAAAGSFYRLKQLDFGGQHSYSQVIFISPDQLKPLSITGMYPNPARHQLTLALESDEQTKASSTIVDMSGRQMQSRQLQIPKGYSNQQFTVQPLAKGVYRVVIITDSGERVISAPFFKE